MTIPQPIPFKQSPNYRHGRRGEVVKYLVIHAMAGFYEPTVARFMTPMGQESVSAHYLIGQQGQLLQMVHEFDEAWACCGGNPITISIEHEDRNLCMKQNNWWTQIEWDTSIALAADICRRNKLPATAIIGHNSPILHALGNNHSCPGPYWPMNMYQQAVVNLLT